MKYELGELGKTRQKIRDLKPFFTHAEIARELNKQGFTTVTGKKITVSYVNNQMQAMARAEASTVTAEPVVNRTVIQAAATLTERNEWMAKIIESTLPTEKKVQMIQVLQ